MTGDERLRQVGAAMKMQLPRRGPAVYVLCIGKEIVYVGQSRRPMARVEQHRIDGKLLFTEVFFVHCEDHEMNRLETQLIYFLKPLENGKMGMSRYFAPMRREEAGDFDPSQFQFS